MDKSSIRFKNRLTKPFIMLLFLSLTLMIAAAATVPQAKAAGPSLTLQPPRGTAGSWIVAYGFDFEPNSIVTFSVFTTTLGTAQASSTAGTVHAQFKFPVGVSPANYPVTATDKEGHSASAIYQVISGDPNYTPPPTLPPDQTSAPIITPAPWNTPGNTYTPIFTIKPTQLPSNNNDSLSGEMIALIGVAAAIAVIVPAFFVLRRRGGGKEDLEEAPASTPAYRPGMPPTASPGMSARYGQQPSSFAAGSRFGPSGYDRQLTRPPMSAPIGASRLSSATTSSSRVCPRCKHAVRDYYSVCPYCSKKLR